MNLSIDILLLIELAHDWLLRLRMLERLNWDLILLELRILPRWSWSIGLVK